MKRFLFWFAALTFVVSGISARLITASSPPLYGVLSGIAAAASALYLLRATLKRVEAKAAEYRKQLEPIPRPDYEPKLFGVPMAWDPETGFWWAEFGCIDVDLYEIESAGFAWHVESQGESGIETLDEAVAGLEEELTRIRNAIPYVAQSWQQENA